MSVANGGDGKWEGGESGHTGQNSMVKDLECQTGINGPFQILVIHQKFETCVAMLQLAIFFINIVLV